MKGKMGRKDHHQWSSWIPEDQSSFGFAVKRCGKFKGDWLLMAMSPRNQWNLCTQELFLSEDSDW